MLIARSSPHTQPTPACFTSFICHLSTSTAGRLATTSTMQRRMGLLGGACIALLLVQSSANAAAGASHLGRSLMQAGTPAAQKCVDEYTALGLEGLKTKVPACAAGAATPDRATCCAQVRGVFNEGGPLALCLCEQQIYELVKGASATAGISGVSAANFDAYAAECQLQALPNSNCPAASG